MPQIELFTDWKNRSQETPAHRNRVHQSVIQKPDTEDVLSWMDCPLAPNRTFPEIDQQKPEVKARSLPKQTIAHKNYRDKVFPNYRRMNMLNTGYWEFESGHWNEVKSKLHPVDDWYRCTAICGHLDLKDYQRQEVVSWLHSIKVNETGFSLDEVVYVLCSLVCWKDGRRTYPHHRNRDSVFESVLQSLGLLRKRVNRLFERMRGRFKERVEDRRPSPKPPRDPGFWSLTVQSAKGDHWQLTREGVYKPFTINIGEEVGEKS